VKQYVWSWDVGGYNSTLASSPEEAMEKAKKMWPGHAVRNLREAKPGEVAALDREYASLFY